MNVRLDVFPALLVRDITIDRNVRVVAVDNSPSLPNIVYVFTWNAATNSADLIAQDVWTSAERSRRRSRSWAITLESGGEWSVVQIGSSGCGSCRVPLRDFDVAGFIASTITA